MHQKNQRKVRRTKPDDGFEKTLRESHPGFREAVRADVDVACGFRSEPKSGSYVRDILRLCVATDAFAAQVLYRAKAAMQAKGVPLLPNLAHRFAIVFGQVSIGNPVIVAPGVYLPHGMVVIDGITRVGSGTSIAPFVTIGLKAGNFAGPNVGAGVNIGTGAKVLGNIEVGDGASIGANSVVTKDVAANTTVAGVPARVVGAGGA